ncbi:MAG: hypothetical protein ACRDLB_15740 [Actinomycetota bacterium]
MNLEDRLRNELQYASAVLPSTLIDPEATLGRGRQLRRRKMVMTATVAAVVIAAGVGGASILRGSNDIRPRPQPPVGSAPGTPTPDGEPSSDASPSVTAPRFDRVETVLREWLGAIQEGDEDRAWSLMTPEAQAEVGRDLFDEMMQSALPEGLGAFSDAPGFSYLVVSSTGDEAEVIGVVSGDVTREASTEFATMAIPMSVRGSETLVDDPFIGRGRFYDRIATFASVSAGPLSFQAGDELIVEFAQPDGATDVVISIDDDERPLPTTFDPTTGAARATLEEPLQAGRHIATVVVIHRSGRLYPEAIVFEAAAP